MYRVTKLKILIVGLTTILSLTHFNEKDFLQKEIKYQSSKIF